MATGPWGGAGNVAVFRVKHLMKLNGQDAQIGYHIRTTVGAPETTASIAAEAGDWFTTNFRSLLGVPDTLVGTDCVDLTAATGTFVDHGNLPGTASTDGAVQLPAFVMLSVSLKSEIRRRYGQGRMLWPVRNEGWVNGEQLNPAGLLVFNPCMDAWEERFVTGVANPNMIACNLHDVLPERGSIGEPGYRPAIGRTWYDVDSLRLNTRLSSLRSRRAD